MIYETLKNLLLKESSFLQEAHLIQDKIRNAVLNREWEGFEGHFADLRLIEDKIGALETERADIFFEVETEMHNSSTQDTKTRFYEYVNTLPDDKRKEITCIYNDLRTEAIKFKFSNNAFMSYLSGVNSTLKEFFELAFPQRSAKMYTVKGTHHSNDMKSMVLNQSF